MIIRRVHFRRDDSRTACLLAVFKVPLGSTHAAFEILTKIVNHNSLVRLTTTGTNFPSQNSKSTPIYIPDTLHVVIRALIFNGKPSISTTFHSATCTYLCHRKLSERFFSFF